MSRPRTERAASLIVNLARKHFGDVLTGFYLVDLTDSYEDEDQADLYFAAVFADAGFRAIDTAGHLGELAYDVLEATGAFVRVVAIRASDWNDPTGSKLEFDTDTRDRAVPLLVTA